MPGIVLNFDKKYNKKIKNLYKSVNKNVGKNLIQLDKIPHISLLRIQKNFTDKTINDIKDGLNNIKINNIDIELKGIGLKEEDKFVLFFMPNYNETFKILHNKIWNIFADKLDLLQEEYYSPESYSPHLTIPLKNPTKKM